MASKPTAADNRAIAQAEERVEALRAQSAVITDDVTACDSHVKHCRDDLHALEERLNKLEGRLDVLMVRCGTVEGTVSGLEGRVDEVDKRCTELRDDAIEIDNTFDVLSGKLPWLKHEVTKGIAKAFQAVADDDDDDRPRRGRGAPRTTPRWVDGVALWLRDERHLTMQGIADVLSSHPYDLRSRSGDPITVSYVQQVVERARSANGDGDHR